MNYEYDIYISYGKAENADPDADQWISCFCGYLSVVLERMNHRKLTFMLHDDLYTRKNLLGNEISGIFEKTAVFITILSPDYADSEQYIKETQDIYNAINLTKKKHKINRIFKVMTSPLSDEKQPPLLANEINYDFFEINRFSKKTRRLDITDDGPEEKLWVKLVDLAYDIQSSLNFLNSEKDKPADKFVFLAETTSDQNDNRDAIKRELQNLNIGIYPLVNMPNDGEKITDLLNEYLVNSSLTVHILGAFYGDIVKGSKYSLIDIQNRVTKEFIESDKNKTGLKRLIWIPTDIKHIEQRQSLYINRLKRDDSREFTEIIEAPLELFKTILKARVLEKQELKNSTSKSKKIYLVCEDNNCVKAEEIKTLVLKKGFDVIEQSFAGINTTVTQHKNNLVSADAVIILKDKSSTSWMNSKIQDVVKTRGFGKAEPFKAVGIISEDGFNKEIINKFMTETKVIISDSLKGSFIDELLNEVKDYAG